MPPFVLKPHPPCRHRDQRTICAFLRLRLPAQPPPPPEHFDALVAAANPPAAATAEPADEQPPEELATGGGKPPPRKVKAVEVIPSFRPPETP